eukprot:362584-Chlamydomonas_euryale.AAC.1
MEGQMELQMRPNAPCRPNVRKQLCRCACRARLLFPSPSCFAVVDGATGKPCTVPWLPSQVEKLTRKVSVEGAQEPEEFADVVMRALTAEDPEPR